MKKLLACVLSAVLFFSMTATAFAADIDQDATSKEANTTLTATKAASYIVVIPESAVIAFDQEVNPIGAIKYVSGNLEVGACVTVSLTDKTPLANDADAQYTIPYEIKCGEEVFDKVVYDENTAADTKTQLTANITKADWEAAKAGNYTATLTFALDYVNTPAE